MEHEFKHDAMCISFDVDDKANTLVVGYGCAYDDDYNGGINGISVWSIRDYKQMANIKMDSGVHDVKFNQSDGTIAVGCGDGKFYKITL